MSINAMGGYEDMYAKYAAANAAGAYSQAQPPQDQSFKLQPHSEGEIDAAKGVNPFGGEIVGGSGAAGAKQPIGIQERELDQGMLAQKAQGFQVGLGGTNNPDDHELFTFA